MNTHTHTWVRFLKKGVASLCAATLSIMISAPQMATASSWDPTLLVNTEAFTTIDDGDGTSDIYLQFGDTAAEQLIWSINGSTFLFTDDLKVAGNLNVTGDISGSGNLTINADSDTNDAVATFGNQTGDQTITFSNANQRFDISDDVTVTGNLTGTTLGGTNLANCTNIKTNANGLLICDDGSQLDSRFVNVTGDAMTGPLSVPELDVTGTIEGSGGITLNKGNAANAVLTFGDDATDETITFNKTTDRFEFSDDIYLTGNLRGAGTATFSGSVTTDGTLSGNALTVSSSTVNLNGVAYSFTSTQGTNGQVLINDGAGNLTWSDQNSTLDNGSGSQLSLHPEYANAVYSATGSTSVGRLRTFTDDVNNENYYKWTTSRPTAQTYDIVTRVRVPENFAAWKTAGAMELRYRTQDAGASNAANYVRISIYDTAGVIQYASADLATVANTWTTETINFSDISAGTFTAGGDMTVRITVMATNGGDDAEVGFLNFNWMTTTP